jgi:CheY-like chemotaxis protein
MAAQTHGTHVLVVDDYPDALEIWAIYLRSLGYRVSMAADGAEAIEQAERLRPDIIVLDLELPGVSGFEAARRIRSLPETEHIPLIAATGYSHSRQLQLARDAGFDRVVVKPCDPDWLVAEIEELLRRSELMSRPADMAVVRSHKNG